MAKAAQKVAPKLPELVVYECEQSSPEWYAAKIGRVSTSNFSKLLAAGEQKGRAKLLRELAAEVMTGEPTDGYESKEMGLGKQMEPEVRDWYARTRFADVRQVGFVFNPAVGAGWSPDGLIGEEGALELKWHRRDVMIAMLEKGTFPGEHRAQVHGALWVGRRRWIDYVAYSHPKLPKYVVRLERDDVYCKEIANEVERFNWELAQLVKKIRAMGVDR